VVFLSLYILQASYLSVKFIITKNEKVNFLILKVVKSPACLLILGEYTNSGDNQSFFNEIMASIYNYRINTGQLEFTSNLYSNEAGIYTL